MARTVLDAALGRLDQQIIQLATLIDTALEQALFLLETRDHEQAEQIITFDRTIDTLRQEAERDAMRLLLLQQPLAGQDLRYLTSALSIVAKLERIGDGAAGIAKIVLQMTFTHKGTKQFCDTSLGTGQPLSEASIVEQIIALGQEARRVLQSMTRAFAERDVALARYLYQEDDVVDVRYHMVRHDLMTILTEPCARVALDIDSYMLIRATYLLWIAHKLERIADHCSNVCKQIIFIQEGVRTLPLPQL